MSSGGPRGILRNKSESNAEAILHQDELDRQEVVRNTRLNASLSDESKGEQIRAKLAKEKAEKGSNEHLKWDEINLYKTEQEKNSTMKIDEPKTPYQGGFNPDGEYYQEDQEEIPSLQLGQGEDSGDRAGSMNGGKILANEGQEPDGEEENEYDEDDNENETLTSEERHKRFEEKRKAHYHMKAMPLKNLTPMSGDE